MSPITRIGDYCTGHGAFPRRICIEGSPNVFANGRAVNRMGDHWQMHSLNNSGVNGHDGITISASPTVFANNRQVARVGDNISCGSHIATGSDNVNA